MEEGNSMMKSRGFAALAALMLILLAVSAGAGTAPPGSLRTLVDLDALSDLPPPGSQAGAFSSTDPEGKGRDCGNFLRVDGDHYVLAELDGPGVITRIWSANAQGQLQVFLDGEEKPVIDCVFKDLFEDRYAPFRPPISGKSSGGWYSYWPIGFTRSCKITVHEPPEVAKRYAELSTTRRVNVPLKGVKELKLVVTKGPDNSAFDHTDWGNARLVRADGSVVYLSDLTETSEGARLVSHKQGWGLLPNGKPGNNPPLVRDVSCEGNPLSINGTTYEKGIGSHSPAEHVFALEEPFDRFESDLGLDDKAGKQRRGTVECQVLTDGEKAYDSGLIGYPDLEGRFEPGSLFYQISYLRVPEGTAVQPFSRELSAEQQSGLDKVVQAWTNLGRAPRPTDADEHIQGEQQAPAGGTVVLAKLDGPGAITSLKMRVESTDARILRRAILKIFYDGQEQPAVWAPVGDFFGTGLGQVEFTSLLCGMTKEGYYCYFPMPFADNVRIEIENGDRQPAAVHYEITHCVVPADRVPGGRFCAQWRMDVGREGELHSILGTRGRGKFAGFNLSVSSVGADIGYLEGNEEFFVDGEEKPSTCGTGTEDYFNGGWYYSEGLFTRPLHGLTVKVQTRGVFPDAEGITSQFRIQLPDCVPFHDSFVAKIQYGANSGHLDDEYASVAYWYQALPVETDYTPPAASEMNFPRHLLVRPNAPGKGARGNTIVGVEPLVGATFAENLFDEARATNADKKLAYWRDISEGYAGTNLSLFNWWPRASLIRGKDAPTEPHRGDVILCGSGKPGTELEVGLTTAADGKSTLTLVLVEGPDYGIVDVLIGETAALKDVDCYSPDVRPSKITTAPVEVAASSDPLPLRIRVTGKNPDSTGYSLGLYCAGIASPGK
jgi:hypothetical protein